MTASTLKPISAGHEGRGEYPDHVRRDESGVAVRMPARFIAIGVEVISRFITLIRPHPKHRDSELRLKCNPRIGRLQRALGGVRTS
jgi:hypothetical protein